MAECSVRVTASSPGYLRALSSAHVRAMADQFISLLCSRLLEGLWYLLHSLIMTATDGASDSIDDSILREALQDSIHHLPQGTIKTALEEDFVTYYEKLKR